MALQFLKLVQNVPRFRQRTHLDGREYVLDFRWSMREERWFLDLSDSAGVLLVGSIKLNTNAALLRPYRTVPGMPPGELILLDQRPTPAPPGIDELGSVDMLAYLEAS